jgi:hypothetical protein
LNKLAKRYNIIIPNNLNIFEDIYPIIELETFINFIIKLTPKTIVNIDEKVQYFIENEKIILEEEITLEKSIEQFKLIYDFKNFKEETTM